MNGSRRRGFWTSRGYVQGPHRKNLGAAAFGTFLWFLAMQTGDDGAVNRGRPVFLACGGSEKRGCCLSHDLQISRSQALRDFKRLRTTVSPSTGEPYLIAVRKPHGYCVRVNRQKKFQGRKGQESSITSGTPRSVTSGTCQVPYADPTSVTSGTSHLIREEVLYKVPPERDPSAVQEGRDAYIENQTLNHVPYKAGTNEFRSWKFGFRSEQERRWSPEYMRENP